MIRKLLNALIARAVATTPVGVCNRAFIRLGLCLAGIGARVYGPPRGPYRLAAFLLERALAE